MKKIVFIGRWLKDKNAAGIHRFALEIIKELDKIVKDGEVELLIPASEKNDYSFKHIKVVQVGRNLGGSSSIIRKIEGYFYKNIFARNYIKKNECISVDLLLQFPLFGCDVIAIYDCRVNKYPSFYMFSKEQRRIRRVMLKHQNQAIKKCSCIVTDSNSAKQDINDSYPNINKPVSEIYCGWQHILEVKDDESILNKLNLEDHQFFFSLGSRLPHKNIKWISYAAKSYPEYKFIVSGKSMGNGNFEGDKYPNLIFVGRLSDGEIKALMRHCTAFIQPSLYEGFGIPPLEAMSVGADCMISDIPVFREIYEDSVWYFDPTDYEHIDLDKIMASSKKSNEIILNKYSWEDSANRLWDVLKREREK